MAGTAQEIWEATTEGTTYVNVRDPRNAGGWTKRRVGGRGSKRITITTEEREFNQDLVHYENRHLDPFTNGLLIQVAPKDVERGENHRSDDELVTVLAIPDDDQFEKAVTLVTSEVVVRRMLALAEKRAPMMRYQFIRDLVTDRYSVGKTSRVVAETENDNGVFADI